MNHHSIAEMILNNAMELHGQPKWTFGKNTCNTYAVYAEKIRVGENETIPSWPILELIAGDKALTHLYSRWFLEAAIAFAMELTNRTHAHITISVKLLPAFAESAEFVETVLGLLEKTGLPAQRLHFELSEAQALTEKGIQNLNLLHDEHQIGLWIGNFGTGHSNLDLLTKVHFDGIELDRSFATMIPANEQACEVVAGIQRLAYTLGLELCAKGIETQEQFEFFEGLEIFKGQGYLIGKPMPKDEVIEYIENYAIKFE